MADRNGFSMSKNLALKLLALVVIWGAAIYFGTMYWKRLFPDLPNRRGGRAGRTWEHPDKEIAAFLKAKPPKKLYMKVNRSKAGTEKMNYQTTDREQTRILVAKGVKIAEAYALIRGLPEWRVTTLPSDTKKWDVFVRTAKPDAQAAQGGQTQGQGGGNRNRTGRREEMAQMFLKYMGWEMKTGKRPAPLYRFRLRKPEEGPAPALSEYASYGERMSTGRWKPELGQALGLGDQLGQPIVLQAAGEVRNTKPRLGANEELRVPELVDADQMARFMTALYGVGYDKRETKADAYLLFHPDYADKSQIADWEAGMPVTREEKALAAELAQDDSATSAAK